MTGDCPIFLPKRLIQRANRRPKTWTCSLPRRPLILKEYNPCPTLQ